MSLTAIDAATISASVVSVVTAGVGYAKGIRPWWQRRREQKANDHEIEQAKNEVLLGRPAIPANPITGEPEREAIPGLGDRLQAMDSKQEFLIGQVHAAQVFQEQISDVKTRLSLVESDVAALKAGRVA